MCLIKAIPQGFSSTNAISNAGCVFVETFEIFIYICAGRQLSNNLFPHLAYRQPLAKIIMQNPDQTEYICDIHKTEIYKI